MSFAKTIHKNPSLSAICVSEILPLIASELRGNHLRLGERHAPQIRLQVRLKQRNLFRRRSPVRWRDPKHAVGAGAFNMLRRKDHTSADMLRTFLRYCNSV